MIKWYNWLGFVNFFLVFFFVVLSNCMQDKNSRLLGVLNLPTFNSRTDLASSPTNFSYTKRNYSFRVSKTINTITPQITGQNLTFTVNPSLPSGINLNRTTGVISGTATNVQTERTYTIRASNQTGFMETEILILIVGAEPLKTEYTVCSDSTGTIISCAGTGQDGEYQNGSTPDFSTPTSNANYPNDFTTRDNITGLVYTSCADGFSGINCTTGGATIANFANSSSVILSTYNTMNAGAGFAGINTWRLPTISELERINRVSVTTPSTYTSAFPNTPSIIFWSSNDNPTNTLDALVVNFTGNGQTDLRSKTTTNRFRYVSGNIQNQILIDRGDGTILDLNTGLLWDKCSSGLSGNNCTTGTANTTVWNATLNICNTQNKANLKWRLPNLNEFRSILDRSTSPILNPTFFPNTPLGLYWTSTTPNLLLQNAFRVSITQSLIDSNLKTMPANYKCVSSLEID
jgi:hypothetical protein